MRGDLDALEKLLPDADSFRLQTWFELPAAAIRLDGLAVIADEASVESEGLLGAGGYLEPFRLRALGIIREDQNLIAEADRNFRALRLDWHAAQTPRMLELRRGN